MPPTLLECITSVLGQPKTPQIQLSSQSEPTTCSCGQFCETQGIPFASPKCSTLIVMFPNQQGFQQRVTQEVAANVVAALNGKPKIFPVVDTLTATREAALVANPPTDLLTRAQNLGKLLGF